MQLYTYGKIYYFEIYEFLCNLWRYEQYLVSLESMFKEMRVVIQKRMNDQKIDLSECCTYDNIVRFTGYRSMYTKFEIEPFRNALLSFCIYKPWLKS